MHAHIQTHTHTVLSSTSVYKTALCCLMCNENSQFLKHGQTCAALRANTNCLWTQVSSALGMRKAISHLCFLSLLSAFDPGFTSIVLKKNFSEYRCRKLKTTSSPHLQLVATAFTTDPPVEKTSSRGCSFTGALARKCISQDSLGFPHVSFCPSSYLEFNYWGIPLVILK